MSNLSESERTCGACGRPIPPNGSIHCGTEHRPEPRCLRVDPSLRCDELDATECCHATPNMVCECECHKRAAPVREAWQDAFETARLIGRSIEGALVGRAVRVLSNHNGQLYGRSRKSWKGTVCRIKSVHVDLYEGIQLCLEGHEYECFIGTDEVEFT